MAQYALDIYGKELYGSPLYVAFEAGPMYAQQVGHGRLEISWRTPAQTRDSKILAGVKPWSRLRLVRSSFGIPDTPEDGWRKIIDVNLMSEVYAARHAIPHMLEQGSGYLLNVASAAGLLVIPDTVSYTVTKHAAIGFTEWLTTVYGHRGIGVSVLCPAAVLTPILAGKEDTPEGQDAITTDQLADIVMEGLAQERFMINTHPWVLEKFAVKARDYEAYIAMLRADQAAADAKAAAV